MQVGETGGNVLVHDAVMFAIDARAARDAKGVLRMGVIHHFAVMEFVRADTGSGA